MRHASDAGSLFAAAFPVAAFVLRANEVGESTIVDLAHVARHRLAQANRGRLGRATAPRETVYASAATSGTQK